MRVCQISRRSSEVCKECLVDQDVHISKRVLLTRLATRRCCSPRMTSAAPDFTCLRPMLARVPEPSCHHDRHPTTGPDQVCENTCSTLSQFLTLNFVPSIQRPLSCERNNATQPRSRSSWLVKPAVSSSPGRQIPIDWTGMRKRFSMNSQSE